MQEQSHYAVGTISARKSAMCYRAHRRNSGRARIIGVGQAPNSGMRKGVITHLNGPAAAIDTALDAAERMSGHRVNQAALGTNGVHIIKH